MGINHAKGKNDENANKENDNHRIMSPYPSQKSHCVLTHHSMYRINHAIRASRGVRTTSIASSSYIVIKNTKSHESVPSWLRLALLPLKAAEGIRWICASGKIEV